LQAVVLRVKLPYLDGWTQKRQRHAQQYEIMFADAGLTGKIQAPFVRRDGRHVFHQYVVRIADGKRDQLRDHLQANGVLAEVYYPVPLHLQQSFGYLGYKQKDFPLSEAAAKDTLALPVYPELTDQQQDFVVSKLVEFFA
jgi:dTDP-4-amino-4,6-dideoxygalactose transaminase